LLKVLAHPDRIYKFRTNAEEKQQANQSSPGKQQPQ